MSTTTTTTTTPSSSTTIIVVSSKYTTTTIVGAGGAVTAGRAVSPTAARDWAETAVWLLTAAFFLLLLAALGLTALYCRRRLAALGEQHLAQQADQARTATHNMYERAGQGRGGQQCVEYDYLEPVTLKLHTSPKHVR